LIYGAIVLAHKERDSCPVHIEAGRKRIPLYGPLHFDKGVFAAAEQLTLRLGRCSAPVSFACKESAILATISDSTAKMLVSLRLNSSA
jgi:hypothetical protein